MWVHDFQKYFYDYKTYRYNTYQTPTLSATVSKKL